MLKQIGHYLPHSLSVIERLREGQGKAIP